MATCTFTARNAAELSRIAASLQNVACQYDDNKAVATVTITDASPSVLTHTREGVTQTFTI